MCTRGVLTVKQRINAKSTSHVHVYLVSSCLMCVCYRALLLCGGLGGRLSQLLRRDSVLVSGAWQAVGRCTRCAHAQFMPLWLCDRGGPALSASVRKAKAGTWYSGTATCHVRGPLTVAGCQRAFSSSFGFGGEGGTAGHPPWRSCATRACGYEAADVRALNRVGDGLAT